MVAITEEQKIDLHCQLLPPIIPPFIVLPLKIELLANITYILEHPL
jgi:hypothetical protein